MGHVAQYRDLENNLKTWLLKSQTKLLSSVLRGCQRNKLHNLAPFPVTPRNWAKLLPVSPSWEESCPHNLPPKPDPSWALPLHFLTSRPLFTSCT